ncbi:fatty acid desaturase [Aspergillus candidus]|uniref:Fatty acid desaturase n=1 Tax=Aspergillus candidus TaxID=41067 RepID=A0A2I2FGM0_ASPCN|nr:fatty acid desaturase [Aspergillus candidus]PLB39787.1 fatty acid desaturase [Aspergillus candidus]
MAWVLYGFFQGCVGTGLWIIAHECGHGSFSLFPWLNDLVGWTTHSILLVPYFSWKITHARHHRYAGHMGRDTAFVPFTENEYAKKRGMSIQDVRNIAEDTPLVTLVNLALHQMLGWPMYLLAAVSAGNDSIRHDGEHRHRTKSHFDPMSGLFSMKERVYVLLSDLGVLAAGWALFHISSTIGRGDILLLYFMPYLWVNHWIVAITYLHHTHPSVPHYADQSWTFSKGALCTVDRSYGFIGRHFFHDIIDYHVVHHLFPRIPFYKAEEATMAIRPLLGHRYREEKRESFLLSLFKTFQKCTFVAFSPESSGVFHWHKDKM